MRYLITGTAGFIGFHLAKRLLDAGHVVTGFDGMTPYYDVSLKQARLDILNAFEGYRHHTGMLEDRAALDAAGDAAQPDVIIHLAGQAGVRHSIEAPLTYLDSNLIGSWNVLALAGRLRPAHLMMASTSSIYGANRDAPFSEGHRADEPLSLYAATKKGMEAMAHAQAHLTRVPMTMFRFFTVYGPWGRPDMALFKFVDAILNDRPIDIYGHGEMARDFTYIVDLIDSIVALADRAPDEGNRITEPAGLDTLSAEAPYRIVNIGGGKPTALMDFVRIIEQATGRTARLNMLPMQPGDVPLTYSNPDLLRALTGHMPTTPLSDGVTAFVHWYLSYRT
ncbi:NAD-dependent epimerase/dehydratase family protein [Sphingomonas sp. BGYR3]|uniref:NAD-dependent epimerase/dehydratase family protein n=1 Tax=Sphingomonas sp. BGYR3 TaxID=2975483 RepID=UPI0021A6AEE7|nr:NAD-dependent epimerase/dehydratase family protein [Sphingomonas sp. BGYR3]MDG5489901.1 NAD-dependent epimerase/dehydratase family protein [Sphingomonas sp. BGYR3]